MKMVYVAGITIALFIEILLLSKKNKSLPDKLLTVWMLVILVHLSVFYFFSAGYIRDFPSLLGTEQPLPLFHGVLLFLYVSALTKQVPRNTSLLALHLLPIVLTYAFLIPFFILPVDQKIEIYRNHGAGYPWFFMVTAPAMSAYGLLYVIWSAFLLKKHERNVRNQFSDLAKVDLRWLSMLTYGLGAIWLLVIFFRNDPLTYSGVAVFVFFIGFFDAFGYNFMASFLPLFLNTQFNFSLADATFWTGMATLFKQFSYAIGSPVWGWLADKVGSKTMIIRVAVGHSIAHFLMSISGDVYQFMVFNSIDGAIGSMSTQSYILLAKVTEPSKLPEALSYQQSAQTIGGLLGPAIGSALAYAFGYRSTYLIASLIFASIVPLTILLRYNDSAVPREAEAPIADKTPFLSKLAGYFRFVYLDFIGMILTFAIGGFINPIVPLSLQTLGVDSSQLLFYTTLFSIASGVIYAIASPIETRYTKRKYLPLLALAATLMILTQSLLTGVAVFLTLAVATRVIQAPIQNNMLGGSGKRVRGVHMGIINSGRYIGSAIGPFIASTMATQVSLGSAFIAVAGIEAVTTAFLYGRNKRLEKQVS